MRTLTLLAVASFALVACSESGDVMSSGDEADLAVVSAADRTAEGGAATYEITVWNLTDGQPLTPPLALTHRRPVGPFQVGRPASFELQEIAENGNLDPMVELIENERHAHDYTIAVAGDPPPLMPGASVTFQLNAGRGAKWFSFVSMLICTNDGFTAANGIRLPSGVGESTAAELAAYDAGTEINTEDFADMVPPCPALTGVASSDPGTGASDPALAEGGVVHHHGGIVGGNDVDPAIHGWSGPVARVSILRIQ